MNKQHSLRRYLQHMLLKMLNNQNIYLEWGFPGDSDGKESACNAGVPSLIPGLGIFPGEGTGYTL